VWILLPERPTTTEEELSHLERQWKAQHSFWLRWLWWWFCWQHSGHFKRLNSLPKKAPVPIDELNRLLGGDAKCSLYTLNDESMRHTVHQLAPKSVVHLFPISTFPSDWEVIQLEELKQNLRDKGHSIQSIPRPSTTPMWFDVISQWIRYNILMQDGEEPVHHIVLFMRRHLEHWNGFGNTIDKQLYLLEDELSVIFPTCTIRVLLNAPLSKGPLNQIDKTSRIFYGFLESFGSQEDVLHPDLNMQNMIPLHPHPETISLLRLLRKCIWDNTGCAP
jgi:hypothetical protein